MNNEIIENWDTIIKKMQEDYDISNLAFNTWIKPLSVYSITDNTVTLVINDDNLIPMRDYIRKKYTLPFKLSISESVDQVYDIQILTKGEVQQTGQIADTEKQPKQPEVNTLNKTLNSRYTFDTFVVGKNNELAHATALAVASDPGEYGNPLFIYGGVGLGKTHLMQSIAHYVLQQNPMYRIIYTTTEGFSSELVAAIKNRTQESFKARYRNIDMLLIDDIQFIAGRDSTMEEFFYTFNALYDNKKQIVISSDKPPKDMVGIEERLISRFKAGITVDIQPPDFDTRIAILAKRAELENIRIDDASLHYIAEHIVSNIRELEGALNQIRNYARLKNIDTVIDLDFTKDVLRDMIEPDEKPVTPDLIIDAVCEQYNYKITPEDIKGTNKSRDISYPRQICMYLCNKYTDLSLASIGQALGNKDHTTVLHGSKKIKADLEKDDQLRNMISVITKKLNL